jgi:Mrp family chromosome partitioning ATPase
MSDVQVLKTPQTKSSQQQATSKLKSVSYPPHYRGEKLLKAGRRNHMNARLVSLLSPRSATAESYFRLRHTVESLRNETRGIVIGVTSPGPGDGKSVTAINLAGALAQDRNASVLLVNLDLRKPAASIHEYLDLKTVAGPGVTDLILNPELTCDEITHYLAEFNLYLIPSGAKVESPYELLKSSRLEEFLAQATQRHDFVILDNSQVLDLSDLHLLSGKVDGFLLVVRADRTPGKMLEETLNQMDREKVLGLVFNGSSGS